MHVRLMASSGRNVGVLTIMAYLANGPSTKHPLFTTGYAGFDADGFLWKLRFDGVEVLIDVRDNPTSRNRAFSQPFLRRLLEENGIIYLHVQRLGVPPALRQELHSGGNLRDYFEAYCRYLDGEEAVLGSLRPLLSEKRCCLMCLEKNPAECHRSVLADRLIGNCQDSIEVRHI
jgi:uncharacterized protein (DUF488 family)